MSCPTTTYKNMDISDLGDTVSPEDLEVFIRACEALQARDASITDEEATERVWNNYHWPTLIKQNHSSFRKGQKVWIVVPNLAGKWDVVGGPILRITSDPPLVYVKTATTIGGKEAFIIMDALMDQIHRKESEAVLEAILKCQEAERQWREHELSLIERLVKGCH
jgi:hypothetical protein